LVETKPEDALNQFEKLSKEIKASAFIQQQVKQVSLDEKVFFYWLIYIGEECPKCIRYFTNASGWKI
jgi:hypothetical protein